MGFTFNDINGKMHELPYEANGDYIELSCKYNDDKTSEYCVKMDKQIISVSKETYLAIEKYKNDLN